jgi:uncharacterized membrane protein
MAVLITLHVLAVVVWVGGMFFAYMALRPAAVETLEPPLRLSLWVATFKRFFPWVWLAVILLPVSGYAMLFATERFAGLANAALYIHIMNGLGIVMILIFLHVFFAPFRRLKLAVAAENWPEGGKRLGQIRMLIGLNLILGLLVVVIASGGRYFVF